MKTLQIQSTMRNQLLDVTSWLNASVAEESWKDGALLVFCPHTTAAITINEAADPDVHNDICNYMKTLVPQKQFFTHAEGNSDAHIKTSLFGPHCLLIIHNNTIQLGTWQGIYFCEWDGPRQRTIWLQFLPS